jgi:hypothetical protein
MTDDTELRWVIRSVDEPVSRGIYRSVRISVLQFRTREGPRGEGWWGEWTDVPTVDESTR